MSRISQTLSLLSNLGSTCTRQGTTLENDKDLGTITERFLPRRQDAVFGDQFVFQTAAVGQHVNAKLVLLAPLPCDVPPFAKSVMYLSSLSGPISATVYRLPGAETHFFRLHILARQVDVKVTLPTLFRGVVNVKNHDGSCQSSQARYCRAFHDRMQCGLIRLDSCALENDDEVHIYAEGSVEVCLMGHSRGLVGVRTLILAGMWVTCRVRRIFGIL